MCQAHRQYGKNIHDILHRTGVSLQERGLLASKIEHFYTVTGTRQNVPGQKQGITRIKEKESSRPRGFPSQLRHHSSCLLFLSK